MFRSELKKILLKKTVLAAGLLFVLLDIAKIVLLYNEVIATDPLYQGRQAVLAQVRGTMTAEKLTFVIDRKRESDKLLASGSYSTDSSPDTYSGYQFGDARIFIELYEELDYAYHYGTDIEEVRQKALENTALYPPDSYEVKRSEKIMEIYGGRRISEFYDTTGYENFLNYEFSSLLILLLLLLIISPVFAEEKEIQMHLLIQTSPGGKASIAKVKLAAALLVASVLPVLFCGLDFAVFQILFHLEGGTNPLYSIESFMYTFFNGSIYEYVFCSLLLKIAGSIFFSVLFLLLSSLFSRALPALLWGGAAVLACVTGNDYIDAPLLRQCNPVILFANHTFMDSFNHINLFGRPVNALIPFLIALFAATACMALGILRKGQGSARRYR